MTDDERPSGTGLRAEDLGVVTTNEIVLAAYAHAEAHAEPEETDEYLARADGALIEAVCAALNRYGDLDRLTAHPDAAAGTTVEEWGVRWDDVAGVARTVGQVESFGTRPGGDIGRFTEGDARYIAGHGGTTLVRRTRTTYADTVTEWEEVE